MVKRRIRHIGFLNILYKFRYKLAFCIGIILLLYVCILYVFDGNHGLSLLERKMLFNPYFLLSLIPDNLPNNTEIKEVLHSKCKCLRKISILKEYPKKKTNFTSFQRDFSTTCGYDADQRGPGQNVISFTLFKSETFDNYHIDGIEHNIGPIRKFYSDPDLWVIRVYSEVPVLIDGPYCKLICKYSRLDWCDMHDLPEKIQDQMYNQRVWRFLPMGDPFVKKFISRDLDSIVTERERMAVLEWENSGKPIHVMRDNPAHTHPILAGIWGLNLELFGYEKSFQLINQIISLCLQDGKPVDQRILNDTVYQVYKNSGLILEHDSYHCQIYNKSIPFPTMRNKNNDFVGNKILINNYHLQDPEPCPMECRPNFGKGWKYC